MGILDLISNAFGAVKEFFGWASKRSDLNNTPAQQSNAEAAQIQKDRDKAAKDIANPDQTDLSKDLAP